MEHWSRAWWRADGGCRNESISTKFRSLKSYGAEAPYSGLKLAKFEPAGNYAVWLAYIIALSTAAGLSPICTSSATRARRLAAERVDEGLCCIVRDGTATDDVAANRGAVRMVASTTTRSASRPARAMMCAQRPQAASVQPVQTASESGAMDVAIGRERRGNADAPIRQLRDPVTHRFAQRDVAMDF